MKKWTVIFLAAKRHKAIHTWIHFYVDSRYFQYHCYTGGTIANQLEDTSLANMTTFVDIFLVYGTRITLKIDHYPVGPKLIMDVAIIIIVTASDCICGSHLSIF